MLTTTCPCGSGERYDACCGRLHRGEAEASTPEELMRARYAAYALGELDFVFRTWHPRTRPDRVDPDPSLTWTGLEVLDATGDEVEFRAHHRRVGAGGAGGAGGGEDGVLHERSRFERRRDRWVYVDGAVRDA